MENETTNNGAASVEWAELLRKAVQEPGAILSAYRAFHNYSMGNQMLAWWQCQSRGLPIGPINTYKGWQSLGRQVRKGSKALELCMPVTMRKDGEPQSSDAAETTEQSRAFTRFIFRRNWFVLAQTDGMEQTNLFAVPPVSADFSLDRALAALDITREEFAHTDGNAQGYAKPGRIIAISPVAAMPDKTALHETAHIVLGHLESSMLSDSDSTPRNLREVEAEGTAYLLLSVLGYPDAALKFSRGYIQNWLGDGGEIPERSAQKIFKAADTILKAGKAEAGACRN